MKLDIIGKRKRYFIISLQSVKIYFDFVLFSRKEDFGSVAEILSWVNAAIFSLYYCLVHTIFRQREHSIEKPVGSPCSPRRKYRLRSVSPPCI